MNFFETAGIVLVKGCDKKCLDCSAYNTESCEDMVGVSDALAVLDKLASDGVTRIALMGQEVTWHPNFFKILDHACENGMSVIIYSDGCRFADDEFSSRIAKLGNVSVSISFAGYNKYEYLKNAGFDGITKALMGYYNLKDLGVDVSIFTTFSEQDDAEFLRLVDFLDIIKIDAVRMMYVEPKSKDIAPCLTDSFKKVYFRKDIQDFSELTVDFWFLEYYDRLSIQGKTVVVEKFEKNVKI